MLVPRIGTPFDRYPELSIEPVVPASFPDLLEEWLEAAWRVGQPSDSPPRHAWSARSVADLTHVERCGAPAAPTDQTNRPSIIHDAGSDGTVWQCGGPDGVIEVVTPND